MPNAVYAPYLGQRATLAPVQSLHQIAVARHDDSVVPCLCPRLSYWWTPPCCRCVSVDAGSEGSLDHEYALPSALRVDSCERHASIFASAAVNMKRLYSSALMASR